MKVLATLLLLLHSAATMNCHYSCQTCQAQYYTQCLSCQDKNQALALVSPSGTGLCTTPAYTTINGLGIVLLLASIATGLFLKSQHIFYFILSMQTLGLLSFVEVAWTAGLTTILDGFQYLMIFSKMGQSSKMNDGILISRNMYRL
jgi:hypothetical protein